MEPTLFISLFNLVKYFFSLSLQGILAIKSHITRKISSRGISGPTSLTYGASAAPSLGERKVSVALFTSSDIIGQESINADVMSN